MKNLRKLTGVMIFLTFVFMVVALFRYQEDEDMTPLLNQYEFYFDEDWTMASVSIKSAGAFSVSSLVQDMQIVGDFQKVSLPYRGDCEKEILIFQNTLPEDFAGMTMRFTSMDSAVSVLLDGAVLYQYGIDGDNTGAGADVIAKVPGSSENFVDIPKLFENGRLSIVLIPADQDVVPELGSVMIGTRDMVVINVVGGSITDIGCCVLMLLMAFIMFMIALIRWYTHQPSRGEVFFGMASVAAGIYCFIGTGALSIFYDMDEAYAAQVYLVLLIPLFLALYYEQNLRKVYPRRFSALLLFVSCSSLLQFVLWLLGIHSMEDMVNISVTAVCMVGAVALVSVAQYNYNNWNYQTLLPIAALVEMVIGSTVNWAMNFVTEETYGNAAEQYCMTIFTTMMAAVHILQLSVEYRKNAENNARILAEKVEMAEQQNMQLILSKKDADAARQEALAANEAKGKFLAHMSHEIRTPINAVLGMDEMILRETKEPQVKEYAMDIYMAGQTLLSLINDILDFSKIDSGKMEIVPVEYDISSMLHDLVTMASQRARDKNIKFEVSVDFRIPSRLYGDDVRIRQVVFNILTNAVKYTHQGTVWLRVQCRTNADTAVLTFEVEDTGIGIKEEDLPKLSAEFARIEEDRNRNIEGTGLGMSITIQLLDLMGSRLQVESVYGKGSKFSFDLEQKIVDYTPIGDFESRVHQMAENYNYSTKFCAPDAKVLVVDDNAVNRKVLRSLLKETLIQVTDAGGGKECLELVQKEHFDLIFLDHMMPEMDGVETLHHIRKLPSCPCKDTPIVVLTANAVSGAKEKYLSEGFDDFLSKPIVPDKLEKMIQRMLPEELLQEASGDSQNADIQNNVAGQEDILEKLPQVDGLDWQYAWLHLPDMKLLEYTVKEFYGQIDSAADRLEGFYDQIWKQNAAAEPLDQYRIQVHAMKSLAATVGILPLSGAAKLLEQAAKNHKMEVLSVTPAFLEEWRSYRQKLQGVFGIEAADKKEIADKSVILALVEMVRFSMQEMDIDQADQLVAQLQGYAYSGEIGQNVQRLAEAVTNLDAQAAEQLAGQLVWQLEHN